MIAFALWPAGLPAQELGVSDNFIRFGQSAAFSGTAAELGKEMRLGIEAAFNEANLSGGVNGRQVQLLYLDDGYEPDRAIANTRSLIEKHNVFALIGAVGTPTSRSATPIAAAAGVPYVAPFTGAQFLRDAQQLPNVVNLRASYQQEIDEMVARFIEDRGISRIGLLYQNDSFGRSGFRSVVAALEARGLKPTGTGTYPRNTTAVKTAVLDLQLANPGGVIVVGAYKPAAAAIKWANEIGFNPVFINISFVGSRALSSELAGHDVDVFMTQVVPDYRAENIAIANRYRAAMQSLWSGTGNSFNSFEGYLAGRIALDALAGCGDDPDRNCFLRRFSDSTPIDLEGFVLQFGPGDNQGSDAVFLSQLGKSADFEPVVSLNSGPGN